MYVVGDYGPLACARRAGPPLQGLGGQNCGNPNHYIGCCRSRDMALRAPTESEVRELGDQLDLDLTETEVTAFRERIAAGLSAYETVREYAGTTPDSPDREIDTGSRVREGDPYNAWI